MIKLAANLSLLFGEYDFLDRFKAAANAGFKGIEYHFPYAYKADLLAEKLKENNLIQVLFNLPAGDWDAGDRGIGCDPNRVDEFRNGVEKGIDYAKVLGNRQVNCLAGIPPAGVNLAEAEAVFVENLKYAAKKMETADIRLMIEAINTKDIPGFFLSTTEQAQAVREKVDSDNIFLQYDIYHMQIMEGDLARTMENSLADMGHIQLADNPGRHEPGSGEINFHFLFSHLEKIGYKGWVGCEYDPADTTAKGLSWMRDHNMTQDHF